MRNWSGTFLLVLAVAGGALSCGPVLSSTPPPKLATPKAWSIGVMSGSHPLSLRENQSCPNPRFTKDDIPEPRSLFVADPFLVRHDQKWLMFFELFNIRSNKGEIGLAESADLCAWKFKKVVLADSFHLSYPFVFKTGGSYFMVPESRQAKSVRLYKATRFPTEWRLEKVLVEGNYSDSTPVYFNRKWWLFTNRSPYTLVLFYANKLKGPWKQHPQSPFYESDASRARPGGRPVVIDGTLIRFVQDNREGYGRRLRAMVVDTLTTTEFREHIAQPDPLFDGKDATWSEEGIHHLSPVITTDGQWVAVLDGNRRSVHGD